MTTTTDDRPTVEDLKVADIDRILAAMCRARARRPVDLVDSRIDDLERALWRKGVDRFLDARLRMSR